MAETAVVTEEDHINLDLSILIPETNFPIEETQSGSFVFLNNFTILTSKYSLPYLIKLQRKISHLNYLIFNFYADAS